MAAFCSFLIIFLRYFLALLKAHIASVVIDSKMVQSGRKAKISGLAKKLDALCLIHRQSKVPKPMVQCHGEQSLWILEIDSLA